MTIDNDDQRVFHNEKFSTYWFPKDEDEQQRLTGQHFAIKELYEGNVLSSIRQSLDFKKGVSILDVGCSSGVWIMDMITDYPNCTYHGCDIVDTTNKVLKLNQFTFSYANVIIGLPYPDNTFDFVNLRFFIFALREEEWPRVIKEIIRVTKPGGMLQLTESDITLEEGIASIYHSVKRAVFTACKSRGQNPQIARELEKLVLENNNVKIIQSDYRKCNMSSKTNTSKKFVWDCIEAVKSGWNTLSPIMGENGKQDLEKFTLELRDYITSNSCYFSIKSIAVQKI